MDLLTPETRNRRNILVKASSPGNRTLNRRTQPNPRTVVNRLGYGTICACYSQQCEIGRLSGSTLNRQWSKKVRDEKKREFELLEKEKEKISRFNDEYREWRQTLADIRSNLISKPVNKTKFCDVEPVRGLPVHFLSPRTKGKVRDKCTAFHRCLGTKKTFLTLTFINDISDKDAVKLLNVFFTELRSRFKNLKYIWIAERQLETTNRIHFHIIVNQWLPVREYNALWVLQQYNAGIIFPELTKEQIVSMIETDRDNPKQKSELQKHLNPFDIKPIRNIHGLSYYLTKYVTKNDSGNFECLAWHCSRSVSKLFTKTIVSRSTFSAAASYINAKINKSTGEVKKHKGIASPFYQLFYVENKPYFLPEMSELETVNRWIIEGMDSADVPIIDDTGILKFYSN
jgi:hypothetical protein